MSLPDSGYNWIILMACASMGHIDLCHCIGKKSDEPVAVIIETLKIAVD